MLSTGTTLQNRYRIDALLGQGGMGVVYRANDLNLNLTAAIKELTPQPGLDANTLDGLRRQFRQEADTLARLHHSHLVGVTDFFEVGGNAYLVMQFIEGENLAERIDRAGALGEATVLAWAEQLLEALAYCHEHGVLHRDIKPQNIIIRPTGQAVLVDFGLVKLWDPNNPHTQTIIQSMGTPEYTPPEQYGHQPGHTDPRSDLYSLGATLYHTLAGQAPPTATDRMADPERFVPIRNLNPGVSANTEKMIMKAMSLARGQRFPSATAMQTALAGRGREIAGWLWGVAGLAVGIMIMCLAALGWWAITTPDTTATETTIAALPTGAPSPIATVILSPATLPASTPVLPTSTPVLPSPTPTDTPTPTPTGTPLPPTPTSLPPSITDAHSVPMVLVPAGPFEMGSNDGGSDEQPVHTVTLDAFYIDQYEVTNACYRQCVEAGDCQEPTTCTRGEPTYNDAGKADHPVVCVSWNNAKTYCEWRRARLPTEVEWEKAARGTDRRTYPWGNEFDCSRVNADDETEIDSEVVPGGAGCDGFNQTAPVGSFPAGVSPYGVYDMAGNVWEWVQSEYRDYPYQTDDGREDPNGTNVRILRGGSWSNNVNNVRAAYRYGNNPISSYNGVGFRCVR